MYLARDSNGWPLTLFERKPAKNRRGEWTAPDSSSIVNDMEIWPTVKPGQRVEVEFTVVDRRAK